MNTFYLVSLGCDKNLVDSEHILYDLELSGNTRVDSPEFAKTIIINTCCFIGDALQESIDTVLEMSEYRRSGCLEKLIVCGCMAKRFADEIKDQLPEVDEILGVYEKTPRGRILTGTKISAHLKIAEGCEKNCTYCIIPKIKGRYKSLSIEDIVSEAKFLAREGVKELIIIAQETTCYGIDLYGKKMLPRLLNELSKIDGIQWIRLMYAYPEEITDELIEEMASNPKICHYIDMPIQHADDDILRRMGRRTNSSDIEGIINKLRNKIPDIAIRTTLITGFPGETTEQFNLLLDFIKKIKFERLGAFAYSQEEGTPAAEFENQIDEAIKQERFEKIMALQQSISFETESRMAGKVLPVLIEGYLVDDGVYIGRSFRDAPDIDGVVFVESERKLMSGSIVEVLIESSYDYDLVGRANYELT